jgi:hypothetical protein
MPPVIPTITSAAPQIGTEEFLSDEKKIDMDEKIRKLRPDESQFTTMTDRLSSRAAIREKVNWLEEDDFPRIATLASAAAAPATSLVLTAGQGKYVQVNDILRNMKTGAAYLVSAVATDTLTVAKIGSVAETNNSSGDSLLVVGDAQPQGSDFPIMRYLQRVLGYNYTEITRTVWQFTNTATAINLYGGNEPGKEAVRKAREHKRKWEAIGFFGARSFAAAVAPNQDPQGTAGGLVEFITSNVLNQAGTALSPDAFDTFLTQVMAWGSSDKVLLAAPTVVASMSKWNRTGMGTQFEAPEGGKVHGVKVDAFISGAYGYRIPVVVKKEWAEFPVANGGYGGYAFLVDMSNVERRPLQGRDTKLLTEQQPKGKDSYAAEYITEATYEIAQEKTHGLIKGCI